jgi:hypothetical protein
MAIHIWFQMMQPMVHGILMVSVPHIKVVIHSLLTTLVKWLIMVDMDDLTLVPIVLELGGVMETVEITYKMNG